MKNLKITPLAAALLTAVGLCLPLSVSAQNPPPRGPEPFSAYDRNGDGAVTAEEFAAHRQARQAERADEGRPMRNAGNGPAFSDFDANGDGKLSPDELSAGQRRQFMQGPGGGMGPGGGRAPGAGMGPGGGRGPGSGMGPGGGRGPGAGMGPGGGRGPGMGAGPGTGQGAAMHRNMPSFADFDANGDGRIDPQELQQARQARITERAQAGYQMRGLQNAPGFEAMDADGDGSISPDEFARHQNAQPAGKGR